MRPESIVRWIAHAWGLASGLLLLAFAFGGREHVRFTASEFLGFLLFPVGIVVGFGVAWRRELAGGLITVASLALFFLWLSARDGRLFVNPYFSLFAAPGFLHLVSVWLRGYRT